LVTGARHETQPHDSHFDTGLGSMDGFYAFQDSGGGATFGNRGGYRVVGENDERVPNRSGGALKASDSYWISDFLAASLTSDQQVLLWL
jgi:hypothetical protein